MRSLLMGGQACVLYGAAEFSRNTDIVVVADADTSAGFRPRSTNFRQNRSPCRRSNGAFWRRGMPSTFGADCPRPTAFASTSCRRFAGSEALLVTALRAEEDVEREADRHY